MKLMRRWSERGRAVGLANEVPLEDHGVEAVQLEEELEVCSALGLLVPAGGD